MWRCLGRSCGSTIKTDNSRSSVTVTNCKHSGPHPVTMRSFSPQLSVTTAAAEADLSQASESPCLSTATTSSSATTIISSATVVSPNSCDPTGLQTPQTPFSPSDQLLPSSTPAVSDMVAENTELREQISQLRQQLSSVLDHSIESDARLLKYTDKLFVANTSRADSPGRLSTTECAVQCDLPTTCQDERCVEIRSLVANLKTTIEVLEADIQCLRAEKSNSNERCLKERQGCSEWTTVLSKNRGTIKVQNRFEKPNNQNRHKQRADGNNDKVSARTNFKSLKTNKCIPVNNMTRPCAKETSTSRLKRKCNLSFSKVNLKSDSHGRHLAGLVQGLLTAGTKVSGTCKPGAQLLHVTSGSPPPPGSCTVLLAGTNDVAAGQQGNIYRHLEQHVVGCLSSAKVVVATLPHRHDLSADHPINQHTIFVNSFIEKICSRHQGVELLDINKIGRRFFTRHGMHLRLAGKRLLAGMVLESLRRSDGAVVTTRHLPSSSPSVAVSCGPPTTTSPGPLTLPHETFADAVKYTPSADEEQLHTVKNYCPSKNHIRK